MKLVLIVGSGAVGKMTVGQELMKITDLRLFHNHMMIEPVIDIFGYFKGDTILKLREIIFDDFTKSDCYGMIHTLMWAFDMDSDWEYVENLVSKFDEVYCIELIASQEVRLERNKTENRLINKASKRDVEASNKRILKEDLLITSNNPIFDTCGVQRLSDSNNTFSQDACWTNMKGYWLDAFYPFDTPVTYLFGDVFYSENALKTIVKTPTTDVLFFGSNPRLLPLKSPRPKE